MLQNKGTVDNENNSIQYGRSLNKDRRKRELQRITKQNQQILQRLTQSKPIYDHQKWEQEAKLKDEILENISEFKTRHTRRGKYEFSTNDDYSDNDFEDEDYEFGNNYGNEFDPE